MIFVADDINAKRAFAECRSVAIMPVNKVRDRKRHVESAVENLQKKRIECVVEGLMKVPDEVDDAQKQKLEKPSRDRQKQGVNHVGDKSNPETRIVVHLLVPGWVWRHHIFSIRVLVAPPFVKPQVSF